MGYELNVMLVWGLKDNEGTHLCVAQVDIDKCAGDGPVGDLLKRLDPNRKALQAKFESELKAFEREEATHEQRDRLSKNFVSIFVDGKESYGDCYQSALYVASVEETLSALREYKKYMRKEHMERWYALDLAIAMLAVASKTKAIQRFPHQVVLYGH